MIKHLTKPIRTIYFLALAFLMAIGSQALGGVFGWITVPYSSGDKVTFKITENKLKFGDTAGWFSEAILRLDGSLKFAESIKAYDHQRIFVLTNGGRFTSSLANEFQAGFITGTCDRF